MGVRPDGPRHHGVATTNLAERAPVAIYRVVAGKRSLFLLAVLSKSDLRESARREWLDLLASAHLE